MLRVLLSVIFLLGCTINEEEPKLYTEGDTWVTEYLKSGGDIRDITGLEYPLGWEDGVNFEDIKVQANLPESWNWNDIVKLQPIRNQKNCGSCWAFSVTAVTESLHRLLFPMIPEIDLAEQTLVSSCCNAGSCRGGYFRAFDYIQDKGLPDEHQDPYKAVNSSCKNGLVPQVKITRWAYVGSNPTTAQIKQAVYDHGPVSVDVNGSFGSYTGGIYTGCGSTGTNHMVTIEGWHDDPSLSAYGGGYWIMRNSWGNWGEGGYMRIVYKSKSGKNCNGIGNVTAYAILNGVENVREHLGLK